MVRVTGCASGSFRFMGDVGSPGLWFAEAFFTRRNGATWVEFALPRGGDGGYQWGAPSVATAVQDCRQ